MQQNMLPAFLESVTRGTGQPLVLVHGSASDRRTWGHQLEAFGKHYLVVSYSRRYHWPNEPIADGAEYSMADHVDDLEQLLKSLDSTGAHLVGHSYGAYVALMVALRRPGLVDKLVLAEPPVIPLLTGFPPKPSRILQQLLIRPRTALPIIGFVVQGLVPAASAAKKGLREDAIERIGNAILGKDAFTALSGTRLEQVRDNFMKAELLSQQFMMPLNENDVKSIKAPTLLITGEKSPPLWHKLTARLEELIPDTRHADIPNASHIMHEDNAPAYNQVVLAFLRS